MQATSYLGKSILPRSRKAKAALAFMCLAPDRQLSRARLAAILWDRSADAQARLSLRQALHEISGAMGELAPELLTLDRETMALNTALCWIDAAAMVDPAMPPGEFLRSDLVSLCAGELLEGFDGLSVSFDQWLLTERARLTWQLRKMFETELHRATEGGFPAPQRASIARQLIAFDATHEGASRALMRALADSGERAQALREYERCREPCSEASTSSPGARLRPCTMQSERSRCVPGRRQPRPRRWWRSISTRNFNPARSPPRAVACASACCRSWQRGRVGTAMHVSDVDVRDLATLEVAPVEQGRRQRLCRFDLLAAHAARAKSPAEFARALMTADEEPTPAA